MHVLKSRDSGAHQGGKLCGNSENQSRIKSENAMNIEREAVVNYKSKQDNYATAKASSQS